MQIFDIYALYRSVGATDVTNEGGLDRPAIGLEELQRSLLGDAALTCDYSQIGFRASEACIGAKLQNNKHMKYFNYKTRKIQFNLM